MDRRCWKHSRQNTGRPCVGRNGTVVSFPHCEQVVLVSDRWTLFPWPGLWARLALQSLHRLGSFLKPLSAKNICSPAVKINSWLHSEHFRTLSWYSIRCSVAPRWCGARSNLVRVRLYWDRPGVNSGPTSDSYEGAQENLGSWSLDGSSSPAPDAAFYAAACAIAPVLRDAFLQASCNNCAS